MRPSTLLTMMGWILGMSAKPLQGLMSAFNLLPYGYPQGQAPTNSSLLIQKLPKEILQYIRDLLPLSSAAAFALSNRTLLRVLGGGSLKSLQARNNVNKRGLLLSLVARTLPEWQFCHYCSLLHPVDPEKSIISDWNWRKEPRCIRKSGLLEIDVGIQIPFELVYVLMKRY